MVQPVPEQPIIQPPSLVQRTLEAVKRSNLQSRPAETSIAAAELSDASMRLSVSIMPNREIVLYTRVPSEAHNKWSPTAIQLFSLPSVLFLEEQELIDRRQQPEDAGFHSLLVNFQPNLSLLEKQSPYQEVPPVERIANVADLEIVETELDQTTLTQKGQGFTLGVEQGTENGATENAEFAFHLRKIDGTAYIIVQRGIQRGILRNALRLVDKLDPKGLPIPPETTEI